MANDNSNGGSGDTLESLRAEREDLEATAACMRQMARGLEAMAERRKSFDAERFASFLQMKGPDMRIRVWAGIRSPEGFQWYKEWMARKKALMEQVLQHLAAFVQAAILWEEDLERRERKLQATLLASPSEPVVTGGNGMMPDEVGDTAVRPPNTDDPESVAGRTEIAGVATRESLPPQQGGAQISEGDTDLAEAQKLIKSIPPKGPLEPPPVIDAALLGIGVFFAMGSTAGWEPDVSEPEVRKGLILYPGERRWEDGTIRLSDGQIAVYANGVHALSGEQREQIAEAYEITSKGGNNPFLAGVTPQPGSRRDGINRAKALEAQLVQTTGRGTINWSPSEIAYIQKTGKIPDLIIGHHINSVAAYPHWAGDPRNIQFVRGQSQNLDSHGGNFRNPTVGPLIDRAAMIRRATGEQQ